MHTIQLDIKDDKLDIFLTIIKNLKEDIVENIRTNEDVLDIESIELNSAEYIDLQNIKKQNNKKYDIKETKTILGL